MRDTEDIAREVLVSARSRGVRLTPDKVPESVLVECISAALLRERTECITRIVQLEAALRDIADGKGECATCGVTAVGNGSGATACDCSCPTWQLRDPQRVAREALSN